MRFFLFSLLLFLFSCSSYKREAIKDEYVISKFDLSKDVVAKFSEKEISPSLKKGKKKTFKKNKKIRKKTSTKKQEESDSKLLSKKIQKQVFTSEKKYVYPDDYPKRFFKYDKKSKPVWAKFKSNFYVGEELTYKMKYIGVTAGYLTLKTNPLKEINGKEVFHFSAHLKTADYYSFIYCSILYFFLTSTIIKIGKIRP